MQPKQVLEIALERSRAHGRREVPASLCPHDEQGRPGTILPAQHRRRIERLEVEPTRGDGIRLVAIVERGGGRVGGERTRVRERALAHEWLRVRSEEHTSELQSQSNLVCRLLL